MKNILSKAHGFGNICILAWIAIYALPAFSPKYNQLTILGTNIRDFLISQGIFADNISFNMGVLFSIVGLLGNLNYTSKRKRNGRFI